MTSKHSLSLHQAFQCIDPEELEWTEICALGRKSLIRDEDISSEIIEIVSAKHPLADEKIINLVAKGLMEKAASIAKVSGSAVNEFVAQKSKTSLTLN